VLAILIKVSEAVAFAHARGVVHRDLKPGNIMIGAFGEVLVMDWGLARRFDDDDADPESPAGEESRPRTMLGDLDVSHDGEIVGTLGYMAPEQARGIRADLGPRSDVYALGAILHRILAGAERFAGSTPYQALANLTDPASYQPPSQWNPPWPVPWELEAVAARAMAFDPAERYASASELRDELTRYLTGGALHAVRYHWTQRLTKWSLRHRGKLGAALVAIVLAMASYQSAHWRAAESARAALATRTTQHEQALRAQRAALLAAEQAVVASDALSLLRPNGERDALAIDRWSRDRLAVATACDQLSALHARDPRGAAAVDTTAIAQYQTRRQATCLAAARRLAEQGDEAMARLWIARAALDTTAESAAQAEVTTLATRRDQVIVAEARQALTRAARGEGLDGDWLDATAEPLARHGGPALVRMLLERDQQSWTHLEHASEWVRVLAIRLLGRLGDTHTTSADGRDAVTVLIELLDHCDLERDTRTAIELAWALGRLGDPRAQAILVRQRSAAGLTSAFGRATAGALARLPVTDTQADDDQRLALALDLCSRGEYARAMPLYEQLVAAEPQRATHWVNLAGVLAELDRLDDAQQACQQALKLAPRLARAHYMRGAILHRSGQHIAALAALGEALLLAPGDVSTRYSRALALRAAGMASAARHELELLLDAVPDDARIHAELGNLLIAEQRYSDALPPLDRACGLDPTQPLYRTARAFALLRLGQRDRARSEIDAALERAPGLAAALVVRAWIGIETGDPLQLTAVERDIEQILARDPQAGDARRVLVELRLRQGQLATAITIATQLLPDRPYDADLSLRLVRMLRQARRLEDALAQLTKHVTTWPNDAAAMHERGQLKVMLGDLDGADRDYEAASSLAPGDGAILADRAIVALRQHRLQEALQLVDRGIALTPQRARSFETRAYVHVQLGQASAAIQDYNRYLEITDDNLEIWCNRGILRQQLGNLEGAQHDFERAVALDGRSVRALLLLGRIQQARGSDRDALATIERAVALADHDPEPTITAIELLTQLRRYPEAMQRLAAAEARWPTDPRWPALRSRLPATNPR
jgi:tetratricopeptide (TPR) repeat protein